MTNSTNKLRFQVLSTASYLPQRVVKASELQEKMVVDTNWITKKTGVETRYFAEDETIAQMAAKAVKKAVEKSNLDYSDIDLLIAAGGTPDQPIPHNSGLIHHELKLPTSVTAFDVDATCLSFVQALLVASSMFEAKLYKKIVIVSSEKPSVGLNYASPESASLLGDGAVAFVLSATDEDKGIIFSKFKTYSESIHLTEIPAGGTRLHPSKVSKEDEHKYLFKMDGRKIFKEASNHFPKFFHSTLEHYGHNKDDFAQFIPHQASLMALKLICKKFDIPEEKLFINIHKYGNLVGASIPMAWHEALEQEAVKEGDKMLLLATAAGLTLGLVGIQL